MLGPGIIKRRTWERFYVGVTALIDEKGAFTPLEILWPDGRSWPIELRDERPKMANVEHGGGRALRWRVRVIAGRRKHHRNLYQVDGRWFVMRFEPLEGRNTITIRGREYFVSAEYDPYNDKFILPEWIAERERLEETQGC